MPSAGPSGLEDVRGFNRLPAVCTLRHGGDNFDSYVNLISMKFLSFRGVYPMCPLPILRFTAQLYFKTLQNFSYFHPTYYPRPQVKAPPNSCRSRIAILTGLGAYSSYNKLKDWDLQKILPLRNWPHHALHPQVLLERGTRSASTYATR